VPGDELPPVRRRGDCGSHPDIVCSRSGLTGGFVGHLRVGIVAGKSLTCRTQLFGCIA
jgi:hypothetical protein